MDEKTDRQTDRIAALAFGSLVLSESGLHYYYDDYLVWRLALTSANDGFVENLQKICKNINKDK